MTVKLKSESAASTRIFASARGNEIPAACRNETKTNRLTALAFAPCTRFNCPASSTDSIESPACREKGEDAVEMTVSTPRQAEMSELESFRSPTHSSTPQRRRASTFSDRSEKHTSELQ